MINYKNPTLEEKPKHAHYPACLGRLDIIRKQGTAFFIYTLVSGFLLSFISLTGNPLQVIGWLPLLVCGGTENFGVGMSFFQMFLCWGMMLLGFIGCGKRKLCHVALFVIYLLMFIVPVFHMFTLLDAFTFITGGLGVIYGYRAPFNYLDYCQLKETEGFPIFSIILTEREEQKKLNNSFEDWYRNKEKERRGSYSGTNENNAVNAPVTPVPVKPAVKKDEPAAGMGNMPELVINKSVSAAAAPDRFRPKSGKASRIIDSGLKFR